MAASAAQTRVKEEVEKSIEKLERDQLRGLQVSKNLLDQQGCFKVEGYSAVKPWIVISFKLKTFFVVYMGHIPMRGVLYDFVDVSLKNRFKIYLVT